MLDGPGLGARGDPLNGVVHTTLSNNRSNIMAITTY